MLDIWIDGIALPVLKRVKQVQTTLQKTGQTLRLFLALNTLEAG